MKSLNLIIVLILTLNLNSCGNGGTTTGNPIQLVVSLAGYNNSFARRILRILIPDAHASLNDFKMCFKRMRFKAESSSSGEDVDLELGEIEIKQGGTYLTDINISPGTYKEIEFDLAKDCNGSASPSVSITNGNGTFTTNDSLTIKFQGSFSTEDGDLTMFVQNLVDEMKNYQVSDGSIKSQLELVSGTY